jgi:hypothetical protein
MFRYDKYGPASTFFFLVIFTKGTIQKNRAWLVRKHAILAVKLSDITEQAG